VVLITRTQNQLLPVEIQMEDAVILLVVEGVDVDVGEVVVVG